MNWLHANRAVVLPAFGGAIATAMLVSHIRHRRRPDAVTHGSARWSTPREIRRAGLLSGNGVLVGRHGHQYVRVGGEDGVLIVGPAGLGKSAMCIIPTLLSTTTSVFVLDLTGDLVQTTASYRRTLGPVYVFDPTDWRSDRLNPLDLVRWQTSDETADVQRAAVHIAQGEALGQGQRPLSEEGQYYRKWARYMLWVAMLYLKYDPQRVPPCSLGGLLRFFSQTSAAIRPVLLAMESCAHPKVRQGAKLLLARSVKDQAEVFSAVAGYLMTWADDKLAHVTGSSTIPLADLQHGPQPMTVYLRVNVDDAKDRLRPFLRLTIEQMFLLVSLRSSQAYRHEALAIFDDVAELGYLPVLESAAAFYRKYGWRLVLAFQSFGQLWGAFGRHTSLLNNLTTWVMFRQIDPESAEYVSKKLGERTVTEWGARVTRRGLFGVPSVSRGPQVTRRPLLTPGEVMNLDRMDLEQGTPGQVLLTTSRLKYPALLDQFAYFDTAFDPSWMRRVS